MFVISEMRYLWTSARRRLGKWEGPGGQVLSVLGLGDQGSMVQFAAVYCSSVTRSPQHSQSREDHRGR